MGIVANCRCPYCDKMIEIEHVADKCFIMGKAVVRKAEPVDEEK